MGVNTEFKKIYVHNHNGEYYADIDISINDWKTMLMDSSVFYPKALEMVINWYEQKDHLSTSKTMMQKYYPHLKGTPYNGIVTALGKRIIKHLNKFEIIGTDGNNSYFILPFEGWFEDLNSSKNFIWKLRDNLAAALEELCLVDDKPTLPDELTSEIIVNDPSSDGRKILSYSTRYERNPKNRASAVKIHGLICMACGFDFKKAYGIRGKDYIEVHHTKPLSENGEETIIDPHTDLICVCSNCHRMIHRRRDSILTLNELRQIIQKQRNVR